MSYSIKKKHKIIHFTDSSEINIDLKTTDVCSISSYENAEGIMSLPRYIEEKSDHLKQRYLNFIKQLSETNVGGKTLEKHLKIDVDFSLWWMSPINEKNIYKQPITSIIKALAIEEFLLDGHYEKVILSISDYRLSLVISDLCSNLGVQSEYFSISKIYASENKEKPEDISRIKNLLKNNYFVSMIKDMQTVKGIPLNNIENKAAYDKFVGKMSATYGIEKIRVACYSKNRTGAKNNWS